MECGVDAQGCGNRSVKLAFQRRYLLAHEWLVEIDDLDGQPTQMAVVLSTTSCLESGHSFASLQFSHKKAHYPPFPSRLNGSPQAEGRRGSHLVRSRWRALPPAGFILPRLHPGYRWGGRGHEPRPPPHGNGTGLHAPARRTQRWHAGRPHCLEGWDTPATEGSIPYPAPLPRECG